MRLLLEFIVQFEGFFPEEDELLFEEDCPVVGEHFAFLLFGPFLHGGEFFLHGFDVVAVGEEEFGFVLPHDLLDLHVHFVDGEHEFAVHLVDLPQGGRAG
jgi:hypothetical protein